MSNQNGSVNEILQEAKHTAHYNSGDNSRGAPKKSGAGHGNWGREGDELQDLVDSGEVPPIFGSGKRVNKSNHQEHEQEASRIQRESEQ